MGYARTGGQTLVATSTTNPVGSGTTQSGSVVATGGTITYDGNYTVHTFTTSGTFTVTSGGLVDILLVGGGGAACTNTTYESGGGGAGGAWVPQQQREGRGVGGINPVDSSTVRCWGDEKPQRPSNTTKQAPWLWV